MSGYQREWCGTLTRMGRIAGAALALAVTALAGCTASAPEPQRATSTGDAHSRAVQIVQTVIPGATVAQAEDMMKSACVLVAHDPTPSGVLATRASLIREGLGDAVEVTAILGAAVAGTCPEHLGALKGI